MTMHELKGNDTFVLEWEFTPADFFGECFAVEYPTYALAIGDGRAEARIPASNFQADGSTRESIHAALSTRFLAVQAMTRRDFELGPASQHRLLADGLKNYYLFAQTGYLRMEGQTAEFAIRNAAGDTTVDTRADRQLQIRQVSERAAALGDPLLMAMLLSYSASMADASNELVRLYEISEVLSQRFGGDQAARGRLSITKTRWSRIGKIANAPEIRQGRHCGEASTAIRDATPQELEEARSIALEFICKYLDYAEAKSP